MSKDEVSLELTTSLDERLDDRLSPSNSNLGFRLILGSEGSVTALPPDGHEKHNMTDEQIIEAVKHMVEGANVDIVNGKDS